MSLFAIDAADTSPGEHAAQNAATTAAQPSNADHANQATATMRSAQVAVLTARAERSTNQ
jgi:hypothetical protein